MSQSSQSTNDEVKPAAAPALREVRFEYSPHFPQILEHLRATLLISTYQAGKLGCITTIGGKLDLAFHNFEQAMGIAAHPQRLAVGTRGQVWFLDAAHELGPKLKPVGTHDACFLSRMSLCTGNIHIHEMVWGDDQLWVVNTLFSCLAILDSHHSFVPVWRPRFVSSLAAEDRCHLNGVALQNGRPKFVTAMSETDEPAGWRPTKITSGVIIDIDSGETMARGLCMPHSPRLFGDRLWVLNSGKGHLSMVDPASGRVDEVTEFPGYTRGLAFCGQFAFVGLSKIRETAIFGGVPVAQRHKDLRCGVGIVDLQTGKQVAALQFHSGVEEIFDVQILPGLASTVINGPQPTEDSQETIWLVPNPDQIGSVMKSTPDWLKVSGARLPAKAGGSPLPATHGILTEDPRLLMREGLTLHENGKFQEAVACYYRAIALKPNYPDAFNNLGNVLQDLDRRSEAIGCYRRAIELDPKMVFAHRNLGYVLKEEGLLEDGIAVLEKAQSLEPNDIIRVILATSLPPVYASQDDLRNHRNRLLSEVEKLVRDEVTVDVTNSSAPTMFYGAYQGQNDRDLQRNLAKVFRGPDIAKPTRKKNQDSRIRLGFISRHFRNHTIGRLNLGFIRNLPRDRFHVTVISVGRHNDMMAEEFRKAADYHADLPTNLVAIRQQVAELGLDILLFSDVGMDTLTYTLALSRLAPVQCVTWGHPVTTGSQSMDYFLSSQTLEVADASDHYTEKLVRLPVLNAYYYRPDPPVIKPRSSFGLDDNRHLYLCFQNLFKMHPEFDAILNGILVRDPLGDIVIMEGKYPQWTQMLRNRFARTLGDHASRVLFLPGQSHPDFMSLNAVADVSLDPIHFGGGNTTYEALAVGLPVITLPSQFLRGRITNAMYQQMGMTDLVATSAEEYVELAVRLGTERDFRQTVSQKILDTCPVLFEDGRAVTGYAEFFTSVSP